MVPFCPSAFSEAKPSALSDQRRDYREQSSELHPDPDLRNVVYGRAQADSQGALWLQYWFFYLYNDAGFGGRFGLHEGDWESVQLRLDAAGAPELAVYAQHTYAERRNLDLKLVRERCLAMYVGILLRTLPEIWRGENTW